MHFSLRFGLFCEQPSTQSWRAPLLLFTRAFGVIHDFSVPPNACFYAARVNAARLIRLVQLVTGYLNSFQRIKVFEQKVITKEVLILLFGSNCPWNL